MKTKPGFAAIAALACLIAGCDVIPFLLLPSTVTVELVNDSLTAPVTVRLFYHDDEDVFEVILVQSLLTTEREETILPGETVSFTRDCDDLRAIIIERAELQVFGFSPEVDTGVLRQGEDFFCGSTIVFRFTHSSLIFDFAVTTTID